MSPPSSPPDSDLSRFDGPEPALGKRKCPTTGVDSDKAVVKKPRPDLVLQVAPEETAPLNQPETPDPAEVLPAPVSLETALLPQNQTPQPPPLRFPVITHALDIVAYRAARQMAWRLISPEIPTYVAHLYFLTIVSGTVGRFGRAAKRLDQARCDFYSSLMACQNCVNSMPHRHKSPPSGPPKPQRLFTGQEVIAGRAIYGPPRNGSKKERRARTLSYVRSPLSLSVFNAGDELDMDVDDDESTYTISSTTSSCFSSPDSEGYDTFDFEMADVFDDLFAITPSEPELVSTSPHDVLVKPDSPFKAHASHVNHFLVEFGQQGDHEPMEDLFGDVEEDPFSDCFSVHLKDEAADEAVFQWALVDVMI